MAVSCTVCPVCCAMSLDHVDPEPPTFHPALVCYYYALLCAHRDTFTSLGASALFHARERSHTRCVCAPWNVMLHTVLYQLYHSVTVVGGRQRVGTVQCTSWQCSAVIIKRTATHGEHANPPPHHMLPHHAPHTDSFTFCDFTLFAYNNPEPPNSIPTWCVTHLVLSLFRPCSRLQQRAWGSRQSWALAAILSTGLTLLTACVALWMTHR